MKINISFDFGKKETMQFLEELRGLVTAGFNGASHEAGQRPVPSPESVSAPSPADDTPHGSVEQQKSDGEATFRAFLEAWRCGLDEGSFLPVEGAVQPDRVDLLKRFHNHPDVVDALRYILKCGSLQKAVLNCSADLTPEKALVLTDSIVSPASIVFPDLHDTYDWRMNPFKNKK